MAEESGLDVIKLSYVSIEDTKKMSSLRLVPGNFTRSLGRGARRARRYSTLRTVPYTPVVAASLSGDDAAALSPRLPEHHDFIYREYLELSIVF